jgi:3,4-dihydroxy 2-butanone 4-phosphate synthase/GTP cyclohydrolase II
MNQGHRVKYSGVARFKSKYGVFNLLAATRSTRTHAAIWMGDIAGGDAPLVRIQSACVTSTAFGALMCDCAQQLEMSLAMIAAEGRGIMIYMDQEGRGHGLREKITTMHAMNNGADTVSAFLDRGLRPDTRNYDEAADLLRYLSVASEVKLMTNNPAKVDGLATRGFALSARVPIEVDPTDLIRAYLVTKRDKLGHLLTKA